MLVTAFVLNNTPCKLIDREGKIPEMPKVKIKAATYVLTKGAI